MASGVSKKPTKKAASRKKTKKNVSHKKLVSKSVSNEKPISSFKRAYREDYVRELEVPGMMYHILYTFKTIFKNWKLFLPFLVVMVLASIVFVGLMSENTYKQFQMILDQTAEKNGTEISVFAKSGILLISTIFTGGLNLDATAGAGVFMALIFLVIFLVTIFIIRHKMAGHAIKLRDALYNAMTPLISTFVVLIVAIIQCLPIMILIIAYSAAVETNFLSEPGYIILFVGFAALLILLSAYLLSSTIMALVAVSAPGLYPLEALKTASDLMTGRRIRFILRIVALLIVMVVMWSIVMMPLIMFDMFMGQFSWTEQIPFIPIVLVAMTCFSGIYVSAYFYLYYRWMLKFDTKK
ncbi:hypothetical protein IJ076_02560 [Candidatus Saccharibacteria bacterium]|nr:hypothetical protein [Candidatus Saccharibacteria bacterium]